MANTDKVPMEITPFVTPDSLRQTTHLLKNLYDLHTKRFCGYEDINGSYYEGTVENWGSEMLLEARKILLDKPSLKNIFIENTFDFYFDIRYSEYINTYEQQNMLCAVLRKDVLLSDKVYQIRFDNVTKIRIPRSESWSDPAVYGNDFYLKTTTPPALIVRSIDETAKEIPLILTDLTNTETTYYFHLGINTRDMYEDYNDGDDTFITKPFNDSMNGFPMVWMCIDLLRLLPDIGFAGNKINGNVPLLTVGTNGHDQAKIYPYFNGDNSLISDTSISQYIIKAIPADDTGFVLNEKASLNYSAKIKEIHILLYSDTEEDINPNKQPAVDYTISYNTKYVKITLDEFNKIVDNVEYKWKFNRATENDYGYDGRMYGNRVYAYTKLVAFTDNGIVTDDYKVHLISGFKVKFNDKYLHPYEGMMENAYSGIHVDISSDHSNNGVDKKNGVVHNLGDFDGLPSHFKYMLNDEVHHPRLEIYSIRDKLNDVNQKATDKQSAGIIIDSGIPQNKIKDTASDMPIIIYYDWTDQTSRHFTFDKDSEYITKSNNLSEIVFVDENTFGNCKRSKYANKQKFVYHGNRHFSLGVMGFDPELEMGRVYIISNDKASYDNNEESKIKKPPSTFARICDIPTNFSHLVNIKGLSPTFPFDINYTRTEVSFDTSDKDYLWNMDNQRSPVHMLTNSIHRLVFPTDSISRTALSLMDSKYPEYMNINESIDLADENTNDGFMISSQIGEGYEEEDKFLFYIGGICFKCVVISVSNGTVTDFRFVSYGDVRTVRPNMSECLIKRSDLSEQTILCDTQTISGNGSGLKIQCHIKDNIWHGNDNDREHYPGTDPYTRSRRNREYTTDVFYLLQDSFKNVWVVRYHYDTDSFVRDEQLTGIKLYDNFYDDSSDIPKLSTKDVMIYNAINPISNDVVASIRVTKTTCSNIAIPKTEDIFSDTDYSDYLNEYRVNSQDSLFVFEEGYITSNYNNAIRYNMNVLTYNQNDYKIPAYGDLNLSKYVNKTNKLRMHNPYYVDITENGTQPLFHIYDPTMKNINVFGDICKDVIAIVETKPISIAEVFDGNDDNDIEIIDENGLLTRNVYRSNEFDMSEIDKYMGKLKNMSRESLLTEIEKLNKDALPIRYEGTPFEFSKNRLINYIIQNKLTWDRETKCNDGPETIYRRSDIKLFRHKGEQVIDENNKPVGEQPTGGFIEITSEIFDKDIKLDENKAYTLPLFLFRLDGVDPTSLSGFKMVDELGNDVSQESILLIDNKLYAFRTNDDDSFDWVEIKRKEK